MPVLRLFAAAREVAGVARVEVAATTVGEMLDQAQSLYGDAFTEVLTRSRVWLNGQPAPGNVAVQDHDVVAVLPAPTGQRASRATNGVTAAETVPDIATPPPDAPEEVPDNYTVDVNVDTEHALWEPDAPPPEAPPPEARVAPQPADVVEGPGPLPPADAPTFRPPTPAAAPEFIAPAPRFAPSPMPAPPQVEAAPPLAPPEPSIEPPEAWDEPDPLPAVDESPSDDVLVREPDLDESRADESRFGESDLWADPVPPEEPAVEEPAQDDADTVAWRDRRDDEEPRDSDPPEPPRPPEPDGFGFLVPGSGGLTPFGGSPARDGGGDGGEGLARAATVTVLEPPGESAPLPGERFRVVAGGDAAAALRTSAVPVLDNLPEPVPKPEPVPLEVPTPRVKLVQPLAVVPNPTRPHARLGLVWAIVTTAAAVAGQGWLAAWMGLAAFVAGSQTASAWKARNERPMPLLAAAGAAALPASAVFGLKYMTGAVILTIVVTLVARLASPTKAPARDVALTLIIAVVVGLAAAAPVLLRGINIQAPLLLLGYAAAYDAGAYLIGTGASAAWEGPAAGVFTLIPVAMLSAVVLVPPFPEATPLILGALAALLAPFGPLAGSALLGDPTTDAPGLRRLDSLLLMGPLWAWCAAAFLQ